MTDTSTLYDQYVTRMQRIADIRYATAVLQWDQETYLPAAGAHARGQQISTLTELSHELFSRDELGTLLQELGARPHLTPLQARNVQRSYEDYIRSKKYTSAFVRRLSDQSNQCFHAWIAARQQNDFSVYEPALGAMIELKKEEAELLGYEAHPYNALLDEYEKGATVALLDKTFDHLLPPLKELYDQIRQCPPVADGFLSQSFPKAQQWAWGLELIAALGFDTAAGRQDISEHPFSISFNAQDVRITTRIDESDFGNMTWSCIHETGHALYEQGLPPDQYGLPLAEACSYSIHESQSRLWENNVGRGKAFWSHHFPRLQQHFPEQFSGLSLDTFYKGINKVQPSLIRTEADEITYHFHVYIRYLLEKALLDGSLSVKDIPAFWKEQYRQYLEVDVPDDRRGCLQDVHWSHGSFGYFPTYSLGSFYAAQFFRTAEKAIPHLNQKIADGDTGLLLNWLRENIHRRGRYFTSEELCKSVTGTGLDVQYFLDYLLEKYISIYYFVRKYP